MVSSSQNATVATSISTNPGRLTGAKHQVKTNGSSVGGSNLVPLRPNTSKKPSGLKAVWFLGGNHVVKLLTSVEGDFDQQALSKLAAVSQDVGELALSVESLVSDDFTVGGFEDDLLAKIAKNTITARRASMSRATTSSVVESSSNGSGQSGAPLSGASGSASSLSGSVPNPLSTYESIPNPLARITPPASPIHKTQIDNQVASNKRKDATLSKEVVVPNPKRVRATVPPASTVAQSKP